MTERRQLRRLDDADAGPVPVLAVVGRPNVGKSTLVNRILGRREAVVEDVPGVTRDRVPYDAAWNGRRFTVVDTGGWEQDAKGLQAQVAAQAELAIAAADAVLFVVDATVGATDTDEAVVRVLRRAGKPVVLVANKVDSERVEGDAAALWSLGLGEPYPVSALHGRGSGDMLDAVLAALPETPRGAAATRRAARAGWRCSAGPTSASPRCSTSSRARTGSSSTRSPAPRATRSTRWSSWAAASGASSTPPASAGGRTRPAAPTTTRPCAPSRRSTGPRSPSCWSTRSETLSEQDTRIISMVVESGRALVIAYNKWDLLDEERRFYLEREIERDLVQVTWAPRVNISARTGRHVDKLVPALDTALDVVGHPGADRPAQRVPRRAGGGAPAPDPGRQAAADPLRHPGRHPAAAVRALHDRLPRGGLPAVRRAPAA